MFTLTSDETKISKYQSHGSHGSDEIFGNSDELKRLQLLLDEMSSKLELADNENKILKNHLTDLGIELDEGLLSSDKTKGRIMLIILRNQS